VSLASVPDPSLLLLVPAYNEERRIEPVLFDYARFFGAQYSGSFRIVIVLNGCTDDTLGVVRGVAERFPAVEALEFKSPIGKGGALIEGLKLASSVDLVGYVDADGATSPQAFLELVRRVGEADCVVGSRWLPGAVLHQSQTVGRQLASRVFHAIVQALFGLGIRDTQCGAKVMKSAVAEKVHPLLCIADMAFDIDLLVAVQRAGYRILEVPTEWTDQAGSKVVLFRSSLTMLLSVLRIRIMHSPFRGWLRLMRPLEGWLYDRLRAPRPLRRPLSAG
jgi:glycosyltransferase involved in cell wall biosynthesis